MDRYKGRLSYTELKELPASDFHIFQTRFFMENKYQEEERESARKEGKEPPMSISDAEDLVEEMSDGL